MTDRPERKSASKNETGSPKTGEPLSIAVGRIRRPHGVKGELIFEPYPEYAVTLKKGKVILVGKRKEAYSIRSVRSMDRNFLISFDGLEDLNDVELMRNEVVYLRQSELMAREDGSNYPHEVLGMNVIDEKGNAIGLLREVLLTGANDVYVVVTPEDEEILLPAIESVILKVDAEKRIMTVRQPVWE
jgi:16S rRNA processing protein RimM